MSPRNIIAILLFSPICGVMAAAPPGVFLSPPSLTQGSGVVRANTDILFCKGGGGFTQKRIGTRNDNTNTTLVVGNADSSKLLQLDLQLIDSDGRALSQRQPVLQSFYRSFTLGDPSGELVARNSYLPQQHQRAMLDQPIVDFTMNADRSLIYLASQADQMVRKFQTRNLAYVDYIEMDFVPQFLAFAPNPRDLLYVGSASSNELRIINAIDNESIKLDLGFVPSSIRFADDALVAFVLASGTQQWLKLELVPVDCGYQLHQSAGVIQLAAQELLLNSYVSADGRLLLSVRDLSQDSISVVDAGNGEHYAGSSDGRRLYVDAQGQFFPAAPTDAGQTEFELIFLPAQLNRVYQRLVQQDLINGFIVSNTDDFTVSLQGLDTGDSSVEALFMADESIKKLDVLTPLQRAFSVDAIDDNDGSYYLNVDDNIVLQIKNLGPESLQVDEVVLNPATDVLAVTSCGTVNLQVDEVCEIQLRVQSMPQTTVQTQLQLKLAGMDILGVNLSLGENAHYQAPFSYDSVVLLPGAGGNGGRDIVEEPPATVPAPSTPSASKVAKKSALDWPVLILMLLPAWYRRARATRRASPY